MLGELDRLAEVCDPDTKVIVIGHVNDVLLYRQLCAEASANMSWPRSR
jgi:pilus assembly protein CpaE